MKIKTNQGRGLNKGAGSKGKVEKCKENVLERTKEKLKLLVFDVKKTSLLNVSVNYPGQSFKAHQTCHFHFLFPMLNTLAYSI
jgi:hypothetical protein